MRRLSTVLALALAVVAGSLEAAAASRFTHQGIAEDAARYEKYVRESWKAGGKTAGDLRLAGLKQMGTDVRAATRSFAAAVSADPKSAESWLGLARALLAVTVADENASERYDLPINASGAAYRAYELGQTKEQQAEALAVLAEAMRRRAYWRPAIDALRISLELAEVPAVRASYDKLRAEHGFRMTDYKTDTEALRPRVCAIFSENLSRADIDFAKFISVDGKDPESVSAEGSQLCIEGLTYGQRYEIQIRDGLPSETRETIEKKIALAVYVPDRKPSVRFTGRSYVLPSRGQQGIPVVSINAAQVAIEVYRVGDRSLATVIGNGDLDRQLYGYDIETLRDRTGEKVYEGEMEVAEKLNEEVVTAFPLSETIGELKPGAYAMIAKPATGGGESWNSLSTQWFIVSDLGLTAFSGDTGVHAFVRSLAETTAVGGARVKLIARNNEVLGTGTSDASGYVRFEAGLARGEGGLQPALLVAETAAGEYAFLDLTANAFDLSDRGVKGRAAPGPLDAYAYTERGVYRPGEEVNVTALVRDASGLASAIPVTVILTRPDGVEHARYPLADEGFGGRTVRIALGSGVMTGTWRAKVHADPKADPLTQVSFLVEDYVPERLDLTLDAGKAPVAIDAPLSLAIAGRYLYGPPAAGLAVEGEIVVRAAAQDLDAYPGFRFGDDDQKINPVRQPLENLPQTDANGKATLAVSLPAVEKTARPLEASVIVRLREVSGRSIERAVVVPVDLKQRRIGVKPLFGEGGPGDGDKAAFEVISLDSAGNRTAESGLVWELVRLETSWQWYSRDGAWTYETQTIRRKVASGTLDTLAEASVQVAADVDHGRFELQVRSVDAGGPATSVAFNAGWYAAPGSADSPEMLEVALDKDSYQPGETAKLRIASKPGGKALVAVLGNGLVTFKEVEIAKGGGEIELTVGDDWGPGAYATALLYRPMDTQAKRMPSRAIGIKWIGVDQSKRTLKVSLPADMKIKSGDGLTIPVKVEGLAPGEEARVTVAAVDVGILNLTRFASPAPEAHFNAQRKLALEIRDFYGRLIDGMRAERGKMRSGGDGMEEEGLKGSPPVEETVALFSGILKVEADGTAKVEFALPDFNGTVRVMAVAWSKDKVGHGSADVLVRDAVALTVSAPRFLTLGDEAGVDLSVHNVDGPAGSYALAVAQLPLDASTGGPRSLLGRPLALEAGARISERLALKPAEVGLQTYDIALTGPDGIEVRRRLTFDVKPPAGDIKRTTISALAGKGGMITLGKDLLAGLIKGRTRVNVSVGPAAGLDVPGLLTALDRYPYGCAEQTVSRALPLVYANAVAAQIGLAPDTELKERVQKAVDRVFEMQDSTGAFGVWGPADVDLWLTAYVTDFLTRAKEAGYTVRSVPMSLALDRLQNFVANAQDSASSAESRAYALYVLARNGRVPVGELRYFADEKLDQFETVLAKAQLGAALSMVGDKPRAERVFKSALSAMDRQSGVVLARNDFGSGLRDGAALVTLAMETGLFKDEAPKLADVVAKAYQARQYTSTQEQAWMLLAAHALGDDLKGTRLAVDGAPVQGSVVRSLTADEMEKGVVIANNGETSVDAVVTVIGASLTAEPAVAKGFTIARSYYTLDGEPVDLAGSGGGTAEIAQNQRLVAVVKVESDEPHGRVLLVDRLPSGLEIDNPRLVEAGDISSLEWLKDTLKPQHAEFRDDRFVAAFDLSSKRTAASDGNGDGGEEGDAAAEAVPSRQAGSAAKASAAVAYIVRAVTPGTFIHPAATVEDMYRPERYARTDAGNLVISVESKAK